MVSESKRLAYLALKVNIFFVCSGQVFWSYSYLFMNLKGLSLLSLGTIGSVTSAMVLVGLVLGPLADRFAKHKQFFIASCIIMVFTQAVYPLASGFPSFLLLNIGISIANIIMMGPIYSVIMLSVLGSTEPGRLLGQYRVWGTLSWVALQPIAGIFADMYGLALLFPIGAVFYLLSAISALFLPQPVKTNESSFTEIRVLKEYLVHKKVAFLLATETLVGLVATRNFLNIYLREIGASLTTIGLMQGLWVIPEIPSLLLIAPLCDRIGRKPVIFLYYLVAPLPLFCYGITTSIPIIIAAQMVFKLLSFGSHYAIQLYIADAVPREALASVFAVFSTASGLMGIFGSYIAGYLGQILGLSSMYLIEAVIATMPIVMLGFTRKSW
ncbi:MAG: MFS transporter [Candidatus Bathyarchaeia archaeon]